MGLHQVASDKQDEHAERLSLISRFLELLATELNLHELAASLRSEVDRAAIGSVAPTPSRASKIVLTAVICFLFGTLAGWAATIAVVRFAYAGADGSVKYIHSETAEIDGDALNDEDRRQFDQLDERVQDIEERLRVLSNKANPEP